MNPTTDVAGVGRVEYFPRIQGSWEKPIWKRSRAVNCWSVLALMVVLFVPCVSAWAQYAVTPSAGTGGSISPTGTVAAVAGTNLTFTAVAALDNMVNQWLLDGVAVQTGGVSYVLTDIQTNHDVQVTFTFVPEGTWTYVSRGVPESILLMLLLSDGSVMAQNAQDGGSTRWYRLRPDSHGSYQNGVWSTLRAMNDARLYCSSAVLRDGRVYVGGGEYGTGAGKAEVYDPLSNTWTKAPASGVFFTDSMCKILPDGRVLQASFSTNAAYHGTIIFDPVANDWLPGPDTIESQAEASWVKLPDDSILTIDNNSTTTERYIPSLNQWISDATLSFTIWSSVGTEIGPALLLPDGRAFFLGANDHTAFYTPSGSSNPGTWMQGPDIPKGLTCPDAPAAMMVNGKVRFAASPALFVNGSGILQYPNLKTFFDYDPVANAFISVRGYFNTLSNNLPTFRSCMLDLPDGTVLYSEGTSSSVLYIYRPPGPPLASGKPTISRITLNSDGSFHLIGTLLNGISEGAAYGDDFQVDSNYPLVRLADSSNNVYYARTFNWSSTSVMTSNQAVTTEFSLPTNLPPAVYSLVAVANGISSDPVTVSLPTPTQLTGAGLTNGAMQFFLNGLVGNNYVIEVSPDLINWRPFSTNLMPASGSVPITNPIVTSQPGQFYRARLMVE